jgi:hypothetical protein
MEETMHRVITGDRLPYSLNAGFILDHTQRDYFALVRLEVNANPIALSGQGDEILDTTHESSGVRVQ